MTFSQRGILYSSGTGHRGLNKPLRGPSTRLSEVFLSYQVQAGGQGPPIPEGGKQRSGSGRQRCRSRSRLAAAVGCPPPRERSSQVEGASSRLCSPQIEVLTTMGTLGLVSSGGFLLILSLFSYFKTRTSLHRFYEVEEMPPRPFDGEDLNAGLLVRKPADCGRSQPMKA